MANMKCFLAVVVLMGSYIPTWASGTSQETESKPLIGSVLARLHGLTANANVRPFSTYFPPIATKEDHDRSTKANEVSSSVNAVSSTDIDTLVADDGSLFVSAFASGLGFHSRFVTARYFSALGKED